MPLSIKIPSVKTPTIVKWNVFTAERKALKDVMSMQNVKRGCQLLAGRPGDAADQQGRSLGTLRFIAVDTPQSLRSKPKRKRKHVRWSSLHSAEYPLCVNMSNNANVNINGPRWDLG